MHLEAAAAAVNVVLADRDGAANGLLKWLQLMRLSGL